MDATAKDELSAGKWNIWSTDIDAARKWSGGVVVQSPPVLADRATPEEGAPPLRIAIPGLADGPYIVTLQGGRDLGVSLDGKQWQRLSDLGWRLDRAEATGGRLEFWVDDRYADRQDPGSGYLDTRSP
jgi:hypothetical protein